MSEENKKAGLDNARKSYRISPTNKMQSTAKILSILSYIEITDYLFIGIAITVALLKDILDFTPLGLPGINFVLTFMASCTIALCMYLAGSSGSISKTKKILTRAYRRYGALLFGSIIEAFVYGIDFLPIETIVVIYMYWQTLKERQESAQKEKQTQAQASATPIPMDPRFTTTTTRVLN